MRSVVESNRPDTRNALYQQTIKQVRRPRHRTSARRNRKKGEGSFGRGGLAFYRRTLNRKGRVSLISARPQLRVAVPLLYLRPRPTSVPNKPLSAFSAQGDLLLNRIQKLSRVITI